MKSSSIIIIFWFSFYICCSRCKTENGQHAKMMCAHIRMHHHRHTNKESEKSCSSSLSYRWSWDSNSLECNSRYNSKCDSKYNSKCNSIHSSKCGSIHNSTTYSGHDSTTFSRHNPNSYSRHDSNTYSSSSSSSSTNSFLPKFKRYTKLKEKKSTFYSIHSMICQLVKNSFLSRQLECKKRTELSKSMNGTKGGRRI